MGKSLGYRRCDNCFFSIWVMSPNRPVLMCKQKEKMVGRWWNVLLEQSCSNFYPSGDFKLGSKAVRRIPLTQGKFAIVDGEDYYRLAKFRWFAAVSSNTFYAVRKHAGKPVKMHREIMGAPDHLVVDHIDHDGLNNAKSNLRLCSWAQNSRNAVSNNGASSKYKGVCRHRKIKKWGAAIKFNKKSYNLGYFENEIDAAKAYDKRAKELHGDFACLNFPNEF